MYYKKNFLSNVIYRLDFSKQSNEFIYNEELVNLITKHHLPITEKDKVINVGSLSVNLDGKAPSAGFMNESAIERGFSTSDMNLRLALSNEYLLLESKKYQGYAHLIKILNDIVDKLFKIKSSDLYIKRVGVRYINHYEFIKGGYKTFFVDSLLKHYNFIESITDLQVIRSLNRIESVSENDSRLVFQYGMYNPDYPSVINKKILVMDYDCYYENVIISSTSTMSKVKENHDIIIKAFEASITEKMRNEMRVDGLSKNIR